MYKQKKYNIIITKVFTILIMIVILFISNFRVIFQKGNPFPYVKSILQLNTKQTYIQVQDNDPIIFITKRDNYDDLHKYIEENYEVSFDEQMGSGYIFTSDNKVISVSSEIYWRYYKVWTMSVK